jgi:hypothetical protein
MSDTRRLAVGLLPALLCAAVLSACAKREPLTGAMPASLPSPTTAVSATAAAPTLSSPMPPTDVAPEASPAAEGSPTRVRIYLVAEGDNGVAGPKIGCDDSIVAVEREVASGVEPLRAALDALLAIRERDYGQSGLYNALYEAELQVESVEVTDGRATVRLTGEFMLRGVCDIPRAEAQIEETVRQFVETGEVLILANGAPLSEALSLK